MSGSDVTNDVETTLAALIAAAELLPPLPAEWESFPDPRGTTL